MKQSVGKELTFKKVRTWFKRAALPLLVVLALLLIVLAKVNSPIIGGIRVFFLDTIMPVTDFLASPVRWVSSAAEELNTYLSLREENMRLRSENHRLQEENNQMLVLKDEVEDLAAVLHYNYPPAISFITAKVVADSGNAFAQSVIVLAGKRQGVQKGDAVMAEGALFGRIVNVAEEVSQVLLLTDVNSRIPVFVGKDRVRAILAGENTDTPLLTLLVDTKGIKVGDEVVTSGDAGVFPLGLKIGLVEKKDDDKVAVALQVKRDKTDMVKILNLGQRGILADVKAWAK